MYEVKNVKTFHGHDGGCWECTLYCDGKRIAICTEDGYGGELQFHWINHQKWDNPASKALDAFVLTLPKWGSQFSDDGKDDMDMTADIHVSDLVNAFLITKDVKKILKKFAVSDAGKIRTWNIKPDDPQIRLHVASKYPNAVILNDVPIEKAVELYTANTAQ
tara:strand:- start:455 stop:940 length:486 start_codon:yes stop_codon:yes gene_type:complete